MDSTIQRLNNRGLDFLARGKMVGTRLNSTLLTQRILIDFNIVTETCLAILAS